MLQNVSKHFWGSQKFSTRILSEFGNIWENFEMLQRELKVLQAVSGKVPIVLKGL